MKTWEVELRRVSYIVLTVEAEDKDQAEELAWAECENRPDSDDAVFDVASVEEIKGEHE